MSRSRNDNGNRRGDDEKEPDEFLIFGYTCKIFPNDAKSEQIHEERHMVTLDGDGSTRVDRYDCRLLLSSVHDAVKKSDSEELCPTEAMEEDMCEEERYKDMFRNIQNKAARDDEYNRRNAEKKRTEVGFNYGTPQPVVKPDEDSDSEDEPFVPPAGIKLPTGLITPENQKLNHVIEKTASFVVANGPQMEIVIKAKQRDNYEQFGFMDFDHKLNPYYKYIQKLIREKKYAPVFEKKEKKVKKEEKPVSNALAAIAQAHGSDSDSDDSDCELHPSLLVAMGKRAPSPDIREKAGMMGPRRKAEVAVKEPQVEFKASTSGMYAELFKNLHEVNCEARGEPVVEQPPPLESEGRIDDPEYRQWFEQFYSRPCPWIGPKPMVPPPPDVETVVSRYAEFVANNGADCEAAMSARSDLQLDFMKPEHQYFSYYHHKVRMAQWRLYQMEEDLVRQAKETAKQISNQIMRQCSPSPPMLASQMNKLQTATPPPPSPLVVYTEAEGSPPQNRRQRRLAMGLKANIPPPGMADPKNMPLPGLIDPIKLNPVSFSMSKKAEEAKMTATSVLNDEPAEFDPDADMNEKLGLKEQTPINSGLAPEPPKPPAVLSNTQMDRKEKAKQFLEKLMEEKRQKQKAEEEEMKKRKFVEEPEPKKERESKEREERRRERKKKERRRSRSRSNDDERRRRKKHRKGRSRSRSR